MTTSRLAPTGGTPSLLRSMNDRAVLEVINASAPISRAQIARECGRSKPTVSLALSRLVQAGVVREVGRSAGRKGASAVLYEIDAKAGTVVGLDVGRGWLRAAAADLAGKTLAQAERRSTTRSAHALLDRIDDLVDEIVAGARLRRRQVTKWVLGTPGVARPNTRHLALATNLPGWGKSSVLDRLHEMFGDVVLENDVNLATIAEQRFGHGQGVDDFVVVSIGTGVGMGLVLGGTLYRGASGAAGEIGYLPIGEPATHNANQGTLEATTGADAVVRSARARGMPGRHSAESIFDAARAGDKVAKRVVDAEAERIGIAVAAVASVVDPSLVVLGGGIGSNADLLLDGVERKLHGIWPLKPKVLASALGPDAVLRGALTTALGDAREQVFHNATRDSSTPAATSA
ncbi:MAG: ROK family protein [Actinomycetes bacterium]